MGVPIFKRADFGQPTVSSFDVYKAISGVEEISPRPLHGGHQSHPAISGLEVLVGPTYFRL
jgi:hypothetical protein